MEEIAAPTQEQAETRNNEAKGNLSSNLSQTESVDKPPDEPEPRYKRLELFDKVMQKSLERFTEHASFNRFASTFRPLYKKNPLKMESIHKHFIEELRKSIQGDISRLIEEGRLELKLNELDKLESAAQNNTAPGWRPSGVPEKDFCSFLMPYYKKQEVYMRQELKKIQKENAALAQKVLAGRESVSQTGQLVSTAVEEWKTTVTEFERLTSSLGPADVFDV